MPRTREELEKAGAEAEAWLDSLDPETTTMRDTSDLRAIAEAQDAVAAALRHLETTVAAARANSRSWGRIGMSLGMSRQAAQERFDKLSKTAAETPARPKRARARVTTVAGVSVKVPKGTSATYPGVRGKAPAAKKARATGAPEKG